MDEACFDERLDLRSAMHRAEAAATDALRESMHAHVRADEAVERAKLAEARVRYLERELAESTRIIAEGHEAILLTDQGVEPSGCYVYALWNTCGECVYVGMSTNVLARLSQHLRDPIKAPAIAKFTLTPCPDELAMKSLERRLIEHYQPRLNTVGIRTA